VFVRPLEPVEARRLKRLATDGKHRSTRIRAMVLLASATEMPAPEIARLYLTDADHVRKVIHDFNERGFGALDPDYRGGRPRKVTPEQRDAVVAVARARPDTQGVALTRWSIDKLCRHLAEQQIAVLSATALRALLDAAGLSFQRTRSWKWSPDPDFKGKAERVLSLYRDKPTDGPVVCFDEMGPIQLVPHQGAGWAPRGRPARHRATYNRRGGTRYLFGAYDVHADRLFGRLRAHKSAAMCSGSCARSGCATRRSSASTWSWTTSRRTGRKRSATGPPRATSSWSRRRPTPASSTASSATSGRSESSSSRTPTIATGTRWLSLDPPVR
jgi:transposase